MSYILLIKEKYRRASSDDLHRCCPPKSYVTDSTSNRFKIEIVSLIHLNLLGKLFFSESHIVPNLLLNYFVFIHFIKFSELTTSSAAFNASRMSNERKVVE